MADVTAAEAATAGECRQNGWANGLLGGHMGHGGHGHGGGYGGRPGYDISPNANYYAQR